MKLIPSAPKREAAPSEEKSIESRVGRDDIDKTVLGNAANATSPNRSSLHPHSSSASGAPKITLILPQKPPYTWTVGDHENISHECAISGGSTSVVHEVINPSCSILNSDPDDGN